jgi:hypothetical protein
VCFVVHKTTSESEHVILTTLYLSGAKNIDNLITLTKETQSSWIIGSIRVPRWLHPRSVIPLDFVKLCGLVLSDSVLLVKNLDRMSLVCQVWLQWDGVFNHNINRRLQTSFEFGDVKHVANSR